jgi:hypothetical protein
MGSVWLRQLDVDATVWLCVGLLRELGIYAVLVRRVELLRQLWLGLVAGNGRLHAVVEKRRRIPGLEYRKSAGWISDYSAADFARAHRENYAANTRRQSALICRTGSVAVEEPERGCADWRTNGDASASAA